MIKPPYTKWINDIKTKLGFNRTMTASGEDVVDAVNKQSQQIGDLADLETTSKTDLVSAVNENHSDITTLNSERTYKPGDTVKVSRLLSAGRTSGETNNGVHFSIPLDKPIDTTVNTISVTYSNSVFIRLFFSTGLIEYQGRSIRVDFKTTENIISVYVSGVEIPNKDVGCSVDIGVAYSTDPAFVFQFQ